MEARRKPHNHDLGFAGNSHTTRQPLGESESESGSGGHGGMGKGGRAEARHEALPHTSPGGKPPETPGPFPSALIFGNRSELSRVRKPCIRTPLTAPIGSQRLPYMTERGPKNRGIRQLRLVPLQ